ncbi:hypothetical protein SODG_000699 [Sodalis praecaptivus]
MTRQKVFRRIILPVAMRQALPAYGNEMISMVKSTSLALIITLMEITGIAAGIIAETYRALEVFLVAGALYLAINLVLTRLLQWLEYRLTPHLRPQQNLSYVKIRGMLPDVGKTLFNIAPAIFPLAFFTRGRLKMKLSTMVCALCMTATLLGSVSAQAAEGKNGPRCALAPKGHSDRLILPNRMARLMVLKLICIRCSANRCR